jgi:hypothetical protein
MISWACNFDPTATNGNGSCEFASCQGCTDASASNYEAAAVLDDGSCVFQGCTDTAGSNYSNTANQDDGSCLYPGCTDVGACNFDAYANDFDGSCEYASCTGCMVLIACNYDATATIADNTLCDFTACCGDPLADNYDPSANALMIYGCIYGGQIANAQTGCGIVFACNYDVTAAPGSPVGCDFDSCAGCMTDTEACNYDVPRCVLVGLRWKLSQ